MDEEKRRSLLTQIERLRDLTPDERLAAASEQRRISLELLRSGLRSRFPGLSDADIDDRAGEIIFGVETWREIRERRRSRLPGPGPA